VPPSLRLETDQERDGRWIAEVRGVPGCLGYGASEAEASRKALALALRVLAERIESGETTPADLTTGPLLAS